MEVGGGGGGTDTPTPPADQGKSKSKKKSERQFIDGYRTAYATIYHRHDYAAAITQLKALKRGDHPDVANLIGYSNRKLGNYDKFEDLVRGRAEGRSEPCADVAVLRALAARAR